MSDFLTNIHFLRPLWLVLLPLMLLLGVWLWRYQAAASQWQTLIRPELLQHLLERQPSRQARWPIIALCCGWVIAVLALAGPTWERLPQPVYSQQDALVLILDLSPSMLAQDLKPNRLTHAKHRLTDLINARQEGQTGLLVYAGDAHLLAPLSDDRQTLLTLVPGLSPGIMPVKGSQTEAAIELALTLFRDTGHSRGQIILLTDGITATATAVIHQLLRDQSYGLSILGVGTPEGAPIPLRDGSFAKNAEGAIQLAKLDPQALAELAHQHAGIYQNLSYAGADIEALMAHLQRQSDSALDSLSHSLTQSPSQSQHKLEHEFDLWYEVGPWLVLLLLPFAALSHRRGWLLLLCIFLPPLIAEPVQALEWQDLWQTPNQQAEQRFQQGDHLGAAERFEAPEWRGSALYRAQQFEQAAEQFARSDDARAHYNRGNALARAQKLTEALDAYQQALTRDPSFDDARANQQLVQKLLEQQQQNQQQDSQGESGDDAQSESQSDPQSDSQSASKNSSQSESQSAPPSSSQQGDAENSDSSNPESERPAEEPSDSQPTQNQAKEHSDSDAEPSPESTDPSSAPTTAQQPQQAESEDAAAELEPPAAQDASPSNGKSDDPRLEKWLQQLPDDPSGLLRRKFEYQYQQKLEAYRQGQWQPPKENRW